MVIKDGVFECDLLILIEIEFEIVENIDLGVCYSDDCLCLMVMVYSIEFDNCIIFIVLGSDIDGIDYIIGMNGFYINVGGIELIGVEFFVSYMLIDKWNFYILYIYNNFEY